MATSELVLDVSLIFGGYELLIPEHWRVTVKGMPVFGAITDKRVIQPGSGGKNLIITGAVIFGSLEISN